VLCHARRQTHPARTAQLFSEERHSSVHHRLLYTKHKLSIDGKLLDSTKASGNTATLNANTNNGIVIVKVAGQSIKIAM
jgi:hypothetical protein